MEWSGSNSLVYQLAPSGGEDVEQGYFPRYSKEMALPKAIAEQCNIRPGDQIHWVAGEVIRVFPGGEPTVGPDPKARLHWFDLATKRQKERTATPERFTGDPGRHREDLYEGSSRKTEGGSEESCRSES